MALLADRVKETTTTTGTGTVSLAGAPAGFQSFNTAFANASLVYYVIQGGAEWEIGIGTTGTGTLARTQVLQSSNADALVPFSAGVKDVFCSYVADRAVTTVDAATLTNKTIDDYTNNVSANSTHFRIKATGTISKGSVIKATGYNPGEQAIEVAVVTSATDLALGIAEQALTTGQFGLAVVIGELFNVNTNGLTVGAIIYSNGSGGFTETKPSSGLYQALGWIVRANANNGVIAVNIVAPLYVETSTNTANTSVLRDGSGNFSAGTISVGALTSAGLVTFASLKGTGATTVTDILNDSTMATASATTLATSASIKTYVDNKVATVDTLAEVLANGNTTGANDIIVNSGQKLRTPAIAAQDGTSAISIANSTGALTLNTALADSNLATISTAGKVSNSATTATSANTASAIVARDGSGNFSAGTITAALTGNASTATALQTARNINGVAFNGTADITVTAAAGTLTGNTLASGVTASSLTSVGTLGSLTVSGNITSSGAGSQILLTGSTRNAALRVTGSTLEFRDSTGGINLATLDTASGLFTALYGANLATTSGNVGVGTSSPDTRLHVDVKTYSTGYALTFAASTETARKYQIGLVAGGNLAIYDTAAAATRLTVDASGNLGLGVTPSAWWSNVKALQVNGAGLLSSGNTASLVANAFLNGTPEWRYINAAAASHYEQTSGQHRWYTAPSGTAGAAISFTQAMTLDTAGRLLLGRTSGTYGVDLTSIDGNLFRFTRSTDELGSFISSNVAFFGTLTSTPLAFITNNTERARITAGGYFKASNDGTYISSTGAYHEMRQNADDYTAYFSNTNASGPYGLYQRFTAASPNGTLNWFLICEDSTAIRAQIRSNGGLANYSANDVNLSDLRIKTDITPVPTYWSKIKAIEVVTFKYNDQTHDDTNVGVIAQQVEAVAPEFVDIDGFGETPADGVPLKAIYNTDLQFAALRALQEAMTRIETLEARLTALEAA
jgi:hypothetical protein